MKKYITKQSSIKGAGKGLFTNASFKKGEVIGLAHVDDQPASEIGRNHNHNEKNPTAYSKKIDNKRYIYASKDLKPGEEITINYRLQPELEQPEDFMRKGGSVLRLPNKKNSKGYSKSLSATNKLFTQNFLFAKPKSRKNKVFDPNSKYYAEGGEYEDAELTPEEIEEYRANGYIVDDTIYAEGGESEQKIIFSPKEDVCPIGEYWNGTKCVKAVSKQPTYADSLFLYNHSLDLDKWMKQNKYYWAALTKYKSSIWDKRNLHDYLKERHKMDIESGDRTRPISKHVKKVGNFIGTSDWYGGGFDDYGLPFTWKHPNIKPQQEGDMVPVSNKNKQPLSYSFRYEPIAIKPSKLLTDAEIVKRLKKYGKSGISESRLKKLGLLKDNSTNTPTTRTVYIDCPPGSVANGQKTDVTTHDPDSPGNYLRTITTGCESEKIENLQLLKPGLIDPTKYQLQGNALNEEKLELPNEEVESEYLEEGSPDTENAMEWVDKRKYNIDWDGLQIPFRLPRFRKPGSYGPLIKKGKQRYINLPTIESRNTAYLKEEKNGGALLTKEVTCKKCGWQWDAADGGDDITTCHKCGGQGLIHAQKGGESKCLNGQVWSKKDKKCIDLPVFGNSLNSGTFTKLTNLNDGFKIKPLNSFSDFGKIKPKKIPVVKDSFLETLEKDINDFLDNPLKKAAQVSESLKEKGEDPSDALRHSTAGALAAQTIANKTGNIPFISNSLGYLGANIAGVGHELSTLSQTYLDDRPWKIKLKESLEDIYNNSAGANTIFNNNSEKDKINYLLKLTRTNQLPDGYGEERPFRDNPKWTDPYNQKQYGGVSNDYIEADLDEDEIEEYRRGGYIVEEIDTYQKGGTVYTVKGSKGYYKKVNGQWQVDWNRSGKYQPLSKGDIKARTAVLDKMAKPVDNGISKISSNSSDNTRVNNIYQKPLDWSFDPKYKNNIQAFVKKSSEEKEKAIQKEKEDNKIMKGLANNENIKETVGQFNKRQNDWEHSNILNRLFTDAPESNYIPEAVGRSPFEDSPMTGIGGAPKMILQAGKWLKPLWTGTKTVVKKTPQGIKYIKNSTQPFRKATVSSFKTPLPLGKKITDATGGKLNLGNSVAAYFGADALYNQGDSNSDVVKSQSNFINNPSWNTLGDAAFETGVNSLGLLGLGLGKQVFKPTYNASKNLIKKSSKLINNTYKINPFALKENPNVLAHRVQKPGQTEQYIIEQFNKPKVTDFIQSNQPGWGRAFSTDPSDMGYYTSSRIKGTRGYNEPSEILRIEIPKKKLNELSIKNYNAQREAQGLKQYNSGAPDREFILPIEDIIKSEKFTENNLDDLYNYAYAYKNKKPHWFKGYQEVPIQLPGSPNAFKSEINWNNWNKEIPNNPELMKEYNTIEQQTKANGTWMKNPDGSAFQGTPEQFVQQNSENFKKAFGNSKLVNPDGSPWILEHGSPKKFDTFDESKFQLGDAGYSGSGIYTVPPKGSADSYTISGRRFHTGDIEPTTYKLYGQGNNPITSEELIKLGTNSPAGKEMDLFNFHRKSAPLNEQLLNYDVAIHNQNRGIAKVRDLDDAWEVVFPTNKQLKSAVGNNGMFDMTNPNIYKSVLPIGLGLGLGATQYKQGGTTNDYVDVDLTSEEIKDLIAQGYVIEELN